MFVEAEAISNPLAMFANLGSLRIPLRRHIAGLFEEREIDVTLHVTGCARIAIPVAGAAHIASGLDNAHPLDARFPKPGRG